MKGAEQELLYSLQSVIVHRGRVDTGHYYAYSRSLAPGKQAWVCLNDANVSLCSTEEMRHFCEGVKEAPRATPSASSSPSRPGGSRRRPRCKWRHDCYRTNEQHKQEFSHPWDDDWREDPPSETLALQRNAGQKLNFWNSMLGCFGLQGLAGADQEMRMSELPDRYPTADAASPASSPQSADAEVGGAGVSAGNPPAEVEPPPRAVPQHECEDFTAARCLVYVRRGVGDDHGRLLTEVRQRVSPSLQEQIDGKNIKFLEQSAGKIADDFATCTRCLTSKEEAATLEPRQTLQEAVAIASKIRTEGGMGCARMYLLRACWRLHVPWLPEELCPTALPPDFRMHYGGIAKKTLLDVLIKLGQHDMASLIVAGTDSDGFTPREVEEWLISHGYA